MKKIISKIMLMSALVIGLVSCNVEAARPFAGDLTLQVTGLPESVKAVALFCNLNEWLPEDVNGTSYIQEVRNGVVTFTPSNIAGLKDYNFSTQLECQFVPMTDIATPFDGSWWQRAFSGSSTYANARNNLVYNFAARGATNPMTLTLDMSGSVANILVQRINFEEYGTTLIKTE